MAARNTYIYHLLRVLRETGRSLNEHEVLNYLVQQNRALSLAFNRSGEPSTEKIKEYLLALEELGVVRSVEREGTTGWMLAVEGTDRGGRDNRDGIGGGRGGGEGGGGTGGNLPGGEGGGGLSEVLAHPVLFCLDEEHQDRLLRAALGILPTGTDNNGMEAA